MKKGTPAARWLPFISFAAAFYFLPITQLNQLAMMPGNIGDARLNNYFLENFFLYLLGRSDSLWQLSFFYPFPYVLGFSDSLFGSAPVYALMRWVSGQSDTAFQLWFLLGYGVNFAAAHYALRRLGCSSAASTIGALIFAFALPTTAHAGHAQLHYRFGLPLAVVFFSDFLIRKEWRCLLISGAWALWQLYCGVYIGFFTLLFLAALLIAYFVYGWIALKAAPRKMLQEFLLQWRSQTQREQLKVALGIVLLLGALVLLFYPYLQVSRLYEAKRSWDEIKTMLPRPQSYLLADASHIWSVIDAKIFEKIPMRHEHQMFVGAVPLLLAVLGFFAGSRARNGEVYPLMLGMLGIVVGLTIYVAGFSIWYFFQKLPLASAIRAMSRIDLAILFPVAYFSAIAIDRVKDKIQTGKQFAWGILVALVIFEFSATTMDVSSKENWRERLAATEDRLTGVLSKNEILFMAQEKGPYFADEIDAMWLALSNGVKTLNGYSGNLPEGYSLEFGNDCSELPRRILSYLEFKGQSGNVDAYRELMSRVMPVGLDGCEKKWLTDPPSISISRHEYSANELGSLSYRFGERRDLKNQTFIELKIFNSGNVPIFARSGVGKPVRISWRFLGEVGTPVANFEKRKDLPFDVPPHGSISVQIPVDSEIQIKGGTLQVSLVQEGVFWMHDIGVPPISLPWR